MPNVTNTNVPSKFLNMIELVYEDLTPNMQTVPGKPAAGTNPVDTATASLSASNQPLKNAVITQQKDAQNVKKALAPALQAAQNALRTSV